MAVPLLLRLKILPSILGSGITAFKKGTLRSAFSKSQGQEILRMQEKRAYFSREETANFGVLAILSLKPEAC